MIQPHGEPGNDRSSRDAPAQMQKPPANFAGGPVVRFISLWSQTRLARLVFFAAVFLLGTIRSRIVFVAIDIAAHGVLLVIHLGAFLPGQVAAIRGAIVADLAVDGRFLAFEMAGLTRRQLARPHALGDARLLIALSLVDAAHGRPGRCAPADCLVAR